MGFYCTEFFVCLFVSDKRVENIDLYLLFWVVKNLGKLRNSEDAALIKTASTEILRQRREDAEGVTRRLLTALFKFKPSGNGYREPRGISVGKATPVRLILTEVTYPLM